MTWIMLAFNDQSRKSFANSETVRMRNLLFWAGSSDIREARARALAIQLDSLFKEVAKAKYEEGVNKRKAVDAMIAVLLTSDNTIADLADANDENYDFVGE